MVSISAIVIAISSVAYTAFSKTASVRSFWDLCSPALNATRFDEGHVICGGPRCPNLCPERHALLNAASEGLARITLANGYDDSTTECCHCYKLTFTTGPAKDRALVIRVVDLDRQNQTEDSIFTLAMPGIAGYYDNSANLQSDDRCQWQQEWLGSGDSSTITQQVDYETIECPTTLDYWRSCQRNTLAPILTDNATSDSNDSVHLGKGHKIAMGVSAIPLFISLVAVTIYCVKRRASTPKNNRESLSATKKLEEQIRWEKTELPGNCLVEMTGGSTRELDNTCIHEAGSRHSRINAIWREALASMWSLRRITQHSPTSPRAPNNSIKDV